MRRFGVVLGRTGTRTALQFITGSPSGRELRLPGNVRIQLEFDTARIERPRPVPADETLEIALPPPGERSEAGLRLGGRSYRVSCRMVEAESPRGRAETAWEVALDPSALRPPLRLRGWEPGDRIRTAGGTKTLKKLFLEERVPRSRRVQLPVLADATGTILWVAGLGRAALPAPRPGGHILFLKIEHA